MIIHSNLFKLKNKFVTCLRGNYRESALCHGVFGAETVNNGMFLFLQSRHVSKLLLFLDIGAKVKRTHVRGREENDLVLDLQLLVFMKIAK